jgi:hypothetical protein
MEANLFVKDYIEALSLLKVSYYCILDIVLQNIEGTGGVENVPKRYQGPMVCSI